jgi:hypothetical protein
LGAQALEDEVLSVAAAQNPRGEVGVQDLAGLLRLAAHEKQLLSAQTELDARDAIIEEQQAVIKVLFVKLATTETI